MSGWFSGSAPAAESEQSPQNQDGASASASARKMAHPPNWSPRVDRARAKALASPKGQRTVSFTTEAATVFCRFFIFMAVIPFLFVFFYHAAPTTVLSIVVLIGMFAFIPCIFNNGDVYISLISATMLAATFVCFLGSMHIYWAHVQPIRALVLAREYNGVWPQQASVAFADAAFLKFAGDTQVNLAKSTSMKSLDAGLNTFCVAPIGNEKFAGRVEFWAVGVDCCGEPGSGQFDCDDAGDPTAKHAYVMQNPTDMLYDSIGKYIAPALMRRDIYMEAIAKSQETEGTTSSKEPLLVRWTKHSKEEIIKQQIIQVVFKCGFVNIMLSALMAFYLTWLVEQMDETMTLGSLLHKMDEQFDNMELSNLKIDIKQLHPPLSRADTCIMTILVPYVTMMLCVLMTSLSGCHQYGHMIVSPFYCALGILVVALMATPNRAVGGLFLLMCSITGLYIGKLNYQNNMFHYCSIEDRRSYSSVLPTSNSAEYWDAGMLKFDPNSYLAQNYSVGFLYKDVSYCAAPILSADKECMEEVSTKTKKAEEKAEKAEEKAEKSEEKAKEAEEKADKAEKAETSFLQRTSRSRMHTALDTDDDLDSVGDDENLSPHKHEIVHGEAASLAQVPVPVKCHKKAPSSVKQVEFWAIGTNCCGARRDFRCDGAKDPKAHSGVLVRETGNEEPGGAREQFFNAIAQSSAAFNLPMPDRPVLIRWGEDPAELANSYRTKAVGLILLTAIVGFLVIFGVGITSFFYMKKMRLRQMKEEEEERAKEEVAQADQANADKGGFFSMARSQLAV